MTDHFVERLHERFPEIRTTETALRRELETADWYAATGPRGNELYAVFHRRGRSLVMVAAVEDGLLTLITVYEPRSAWDRRLADARPFPFGMVLALAS